MNAGSPGSDIWTPDLTLFRNGPHEHTHEVFLYWIRPSIHQSQYSLPRLAAAFQNPRWRSSSWYVNWRSWGLNQTDILQWNYGVPPHSYLSVGCFQDEFCVRMLKERKGTEMVLLCNIIAELSTGWLFCKIFMRRQQRFCKQSINHKLNGGKDSLHLFFIFFFLILVYSALNCIKKIPQPV